MKAMILAAGLGTRLRPFTDHTPKPLFTIAGRPLLDILIRNLQKACCSAVIINTHHLHHQIEAFIAEQKYPFPVLTRFEPQILGTGGAIKNVADFWDDQPFLVVNGDIVTDISFKEVFELHGRQRCPATLVLCNDPEFNTVSIAAGDWITAFLDSSDTAGRTSESSLTFTGIQVLEPEVLQYIPENTSSSIIDAFRRLLADGKKIKACIAGKKMWKDIGTPQRYKEAVFQNTLPRVFRQVFPEPETVPNHVDRIKLKGDGSERRWFRLQSGRHTLILVDHGIRETRLTSEVDSFVQIGCHLYRQGVSVPKIHFDDTFAGLVILEDLGNLDLQQVVKRSSGRDTIVALYKKVIAQLIRMSQRGADGFEPSWSYQTPTYDHALILEKECRYFVEAFLNGYLGIQIAFTDYHDEFSALARQALRYPLTGFMHRDVQSRNIMIKDKAVYFIDFQGGRLGPVQYDLASLLIDPYVELSRSIQTELLAYAIDLLSTVKNFDPEKFRLCFRYCSLTRNLQILGAFGYLSKVRGKGYFEKYIPAAVKSLNANLAGEGRAEFPGLTAVAEKISRQLMG
jgi:aminoglycoside/choline kinase family phosphotransferase/dTDP-glucose pyrophosphorylase